MIVLERLELEAFRGFSDRQAISLDSDAVVITGANGLGKTSLTDAVTWVLTDTLPQMPDRARRGEEYVVNRYREGSQADVSLWMRGEDGSVRLRRRGSSKSGSELSIEADGRLVVGKEALNMMCSVFGARSKRDLDMAVHGWGILRQDAMRAVLNAPAEDLQARLRDILGLEVLAAFERAAKRAHKKAADEVGSAREQARRCEQDLAAASAAVADVQAKIARGMANEVSAEAGDQLERLSDLLEVRELTLSDPAVVEEIVNDANMVERELSSIDLRIRSLLSTTAAVVDDDSAAHEAELAQLESSVSSLEEELALAHATLAAAEAEYGALHEAADDMAELAVAALPLLGRTCPVCAQEIDAESVRERLRQAMDDRGVAGGVLEAAAAAASERHDLVRSLEARLQAEKETFGLLRERVVRREHNRLELGRLNDRLDAVVQGSRIRLKAFAQQRDNEVRDPNALRNTAAALEALQRALVPIVRAAKENAVAERLPRLERERSDADARSSSAVRTLEAVSRRESEAERLLAATTAASVDVTRDALTALDPYFAEVFRRLATHPTFSELGMLHDVYYGKPRTWARLYDPLTGVEANPQLVLSEGQLNVVALSYFVAFALTAGARVLPFMIMDDPLQSLDDMNVLGFSDLCRHLRDGRQLIVTTHDERFGALLRRKLRPRKQGQSLAHIAFQSWERGGPSLEYERVEGHLEPTLLTDVG